MSEQLTKQRPAAVEGEGAQKLKTVNVPPVDGLLAELDGAAIKAAEAKKAKKAAELAERQRRKQELEQAAKRCGCW